MLSRTAFWAGLIALQGACSGGEPASVSAGAGGGGAGSGGSGAGAAAGAGGATTSTTGTPPPDASPPPVSGCVPGSHTTFEVGEGLAFTTLGAVPWATLGPGDTVRIHPKIGGWHEKILLNTRGEEGAPIRVCGMRGGDGALPVIDGADATTAPDAAFGDYLPLQDLGLVTIARGAQTYGFRAGHIVIEGLVIQGGKTGSTYTATTGEVRAYDAFAAGVNLNAGDHVTLRGCEIRDNGNGLFANSRGEDESTLTRDVLVEGNYFHGNGVEGSYSEHDAYTQALGVVYQYNRFGPLRPGAVGAALKDRSAGTVVRYNFIEGTVRSIDLVDAQDHAAAAIADPRYRETFVYGNVIVSIAGDATRLVHYGGDTTGFEQNFRKGTLYFYGNTVVSRHTQDEAWQVSVLYASTDDETIDFRGNVVDHIGSSAIALMTEAGRLAIGKNWLPTGWLPGTDKFKGTVTGGEDVLVGVDAKLDPTSRRPLAGSPVIDQAPAIAPAAAGYPVDREYSEDGRGVARPVNGGASDLGALEGP